MTIDRRKDSLSETIKNAASGYGVIVLAVACFILSLAAIAFFIRLIVGASTGTGA